MSEICLTDNKRIFRSHDECVAACTEYMEPYLCRGCLGWHRGHTKKGRRAERRAGLQRMVQEAELAGLYDAPEVSLVEKPGRSV